MDLNGAAPGPATLSRGMTWAMAAACGLAVTNIYYNQPLLGILEAEFGRSGAIGFLPTVTQLGYAAGVLFLVPLGDGVQRRTLILSQTAVLAVALFLATVAPTAPTLLAASALIGVTATVAQQIVPFAADLAAPEKRGGVIGTVMTGLFCGLLLGRTVAGYVGESFGWRAVFALGFVATLGMAAALAVVLPRQEERAPVSYPVLLRSLLGLLRDEPGLRWATAIQALLFASFSVFWTVLAFRLERPPFGLGADVAGLFGLLGAAGVLAARPVGRLADRRGPRVSLGTGIVLVVVAWFVLGALPSLAGLVVGVLILDVGVQSALISNQHIIFALRPEARNRINTVFVTALFLGGAAGSAASNALWRTVGWTGVCLLGGTLAVGALLLFTLNSRSMRARGQPARA